VKREEVVLSEPLCRAAFLMGVGEYVEQFGVSYPRVLARAGLEEAEVSDPNHFIPLERECAVLEEAARTTGREALMLELSSRQSVAIFGAVGALAMGSSTVLAGLDVFRNYLHYNLQEVRLDLRVRRDTAFFTLHTDFPPARQSERFWHHAVALMCQILRWFCGQRWSPGLVYLDQETPADLRPFADYFRAPLAFAQGQNGIAFDAAVLDWPIEGSLSTVSAQLREFLNAGDAARLPDQVRAMVHSLLMTGRCSQAVVASSLGLSERTLQRRLQEEGTGFRELLDEVRSGLAVNYMREPRFRLTDVAQMLGYSELSAFTRSFRRWVGVSPRQWRTLPGRR
jgi:AraC-like DNA-binding protein